MRGDIFFAEPLAQLVRHRSAMPPRVHEDQRRAMLLDQFDEPVVDLVPHFVDGDGTKCAARDFDGQIELPPVADVDDDRVGAAVAGQKVGDFFDGFLGGRQSDALRAGGGQGLQPLERNRQVCAALVVGHRVNFVHDDGFDIAQDARGCFPRSAGCRATRAW